MELQTLEMEFLDINLTKDSSLLLHAIDSPFYRRILKKTILSSVLKNTRKTRKLGYIHEYHSVERKNYGRKLESEKIQVYAQKPLTTMLIKNSISGVVKQFCRI